MGRLNVACVNEARAPVALQGSSPVGYSGGLLTFLTSHWSQGCLQDAATATDVTPKHQACWSSKQR